MHYYIDGYNYLFRTLASGVSLKLHREALIYDLNQKATLLNLEITIVFDAQYQEGDETITHFGNLAIIYTAEKQTADELLIKILDHTEIPKQSILITSDNKLSKQAKIIPVKTQTTEEFIEWINKKYKNRILNPVENDVEEKKKIEIQEIPYKPKSLTEYYEMIFTKKLEGSSIEATKEIQEKTKKEKKLEQPKTLKSAPSKESDFDRWLRLFGGI